MLRWSIRAAVSGVVVAILLAVIPFHAVVDSLKQLSPLVGFASLALLFSGHFLNAIKLRLLLGDVDASHGGSRGLTAACVRAQFAGLIANIGLPGLAGGDLVRAAYLAPITGIARVAVASFVDRVIDTLMIVALIAVALPLAGLPPGIAGAAERAGLWIGGGIVLMAIVGAIALRLRRFAGIAASLSQAWTSLKARPSALAGALVISLVVQTTFVMTNLWMARQVGVKTSLAAWFVAWPLSKLVAVLPISLGGIGVREAVLVACLAPYGAEREAVLASGFLWQALYLVTALLGLGFTHLLPRPLPPSNEPSVERA